MSLMKWTLAMVGTALGLRYLSDRRRGRTGGDTGARQGKPESGDGRSASQSGSAGGGLASGSPAARGRSDDLLTPDSTAAPGASSHRF